MGTKTALKNYDEKLATFYVEKVCSEADVVYRFAYALCLNREDAFAAVIRAFEKAVERLDKLYGMPSMAIRALLIQSAWQHIPAGAAGQGDRSGSPVQKLMQSLDRESRAILFTVDVAGLSFGETATTLGMSEDTVRKRLALARAELVPGAKVAEPEFVFLNLPEHLNEELPADKEQRILKLLENASDKSLADKFKQALGNFQLAMQGYYLAEIQNTKIQELVETKEVRETMEAQKIEEVDQWEATGNMRRRAMITLVALVAIFALVYYFTPKREAPFNALQNIVYEALAMEEDVDSSRLNLPSNDINEIAEFFAQHPGLEFSPEILAKLPSDWRPAGASVIDYETNKVSVVQYFNTVRKEFLFIFSYKAKLSDLPKSEPGKVDGLTYQTYTSEQLNVVAWQSTPNTVSMVVGRRSAPELAAFARQGTKD